MSNSGDAGVELLLGQLVDYLDTIFLLHDGGVGPGVVDGDVEVVFLQGIVDVDDLRVADIGTVLLEGEAQNQDVAVEDLDAFLEHELDGLGGHIGSHAIVHSAASEDNLGVVAIALSALRQIIRVNANAVTTHQTGTEGQEVPLGASSLQHVKGVDAHSVEDLAQLVDESDVDVALAVLDDLGSFGNFHGRSKMSASTDDRTVDLVDILANLGGGARGDFLDMLDSVLLVTGVDALGAVASEEVDIHLHAAELLHDGDAFVFGDTGVDGGFVNDG